DCAFLTRGGLEVHAANGRDLWWGNRSAPRLLRDVSGQFAVQTASVPASTDRHAIGGLLLWKDERTFLRLERGARGAHEIWFSACIEDEQHVVGRGRLPSERIFLRLERRESR